MVLVNTPRPFMYVSGRSDTGPKYVFKEGLKEVTDLFDEFTAHASKTTTWKFKKKVVKLALKIFGSKSNWFTSIDDDLNIQNYHYAFIVDTIRYIATGSRNIHINSWGSLLTHPADGRITKNHDQIRAFFKEYSLRSDHKLLIQCWCSQRDGLYDLMYTMHYLYGDHFTRETNQKHDTTHYGTSDVD